MDGGRRCEPPDADRSWRGDRCCDRCRRRSPPSARHGRHGRATTTPPPSRDHHRSRPPFRHGDDGPRSSDADRAAAGRASAGGLASGAARPARRCRPSPIGCAAGPDGAAPAQARPCRVRHRGRPGRPRFTRPRPNWSGGEQRPCAPGATGRPRAIDAQRRRRGSTTPARRRSRDRARHPHPGRPGRRARPVP